MKHSNSSSKWDVTKASVFKLAETVEDAVIYPKSNKYFVEMSAPLNLFAQIAQRVHVSPLIEIEKQFMTEFDYIQEARQFEMVWKNMMKSGIAGVMQNTQTVVRVV